jgi:hypothetical protein
MNTVDLKLHGEAQSKLGDHQSGHRSKQAHLSMMIAQVDPVERYSTKGKIPRIPEEEKLCTEKQDRFLNLPPSSA